MTAASILFTTSGVEDGADLGLGVCEHLQHIRVQELGLLKLKGERLWHRPLVGLIGEVPVRVVAHLAAYNHSARSILISMFPSWISSLTSCGRSRAVMAKHPSPPQVQAFWLAASQ